MQITNVMRKELLLSFVIATVTSVTFALEEQGNSPVVERAELTRPFSSSTYFISGITDPMATLEEVLKKGLPVAEAWHPNHDGPCMRVELQQLVIRLTEPDPAIYELGFSRDSSSAIGSCTDTWKQYRY